MDAGESAGLTELRAATLTHREYCIDKARRFPASGPAAPALRDGQSVQLTDRIALENMRVRFNLALGQASPDPASGAVTISVFPRE